MGITDSPIAFWCYLLSATGFLLFSLHLAAAWKGGVRGSLILAAVVFSALWTASLAAFLHFDFAFLVPLAAFFNNLRLLAWFAFLLSLINATRVGQGNGGTAKDAFSPLPLFAAAATLATLNFLALGFPDQIHNLLGYGSQLPFAPALTLAVMGLVLVEQMLRNAPAANRWSLKPMALALGGVFCFDLFLYAEAFLFKHADPEAWAVRGLINALTIPLLALSTARTKAWNIKVTVSRHIVFHSAALLAAGLYLLAIAGAGYYLRYFGGSWGGALQIVLLFTGILVLLVLLTSGSARSKLRVYISKHFFSYRYDYRQEWLRFTQSLSSPAPQGEGLPEMVIKALSNLVESPAGSLWLADGSGVMRQTARLYTPAVQETEGADSAMLAFLARTQWILDLNELASSPEDYDHLEIPAWLKNTQDAWLVIPLFFEQKLFGFVVLAKPRAKIEINWEVLDLLKTASSQAASYLTHMRAADALLEAKKFDSFNRMSAFVVHDIKNLVAQLSLLLKNAERHKDNPEFQQDMFMTIAHAVDRMKHLLLQLRAGTTPVDQPRPVALAGVLHKVSAAKASRKPELTLRVTEDAEVLGHADRLERVIGHLVQNALDATPPEGRVWLALSREASKATVEVGDTGCGMSRDFVRDRLFKPFDSTKNSGMGVGAYESAQYISELGGRLDVDSEPGHGTVMHIVLPLHRRQEASNRETETP